MVLDVVSTLPPIANPSARRAVCEAALRPLGLTLSPEFLDALVPQPRFKLVTGGWQAGKALALGTEVRTIHGPRKIEDMQPGDIVFDHEGTPCRVKALSPVWEQRKCWRIRFADMSSVVVDEEHEWLVERTQNWARSSEDTSQWRETSSARYTTKAMRHLKLPIKLPGSDTFITGFEESSTRDTQCIEVDSPWHTFQLANGVPTGNSTELAAEVWCETPLMDMDKRYLVWIIVPSYRSPHKEIDYLKTWGEQTGILTYARVPGLEQGVPCVLEYWHGVVRIETKTAQDIAGIAGEPCDLVIIAEPGQMPESVVGQVMGRVITKRGRAVAGGTIEDAEMKVRYAWYPEMAATLQAEGPTEEAGAFELPSWANLAVFPRGRQDPEIVRLEQDPPRGLGKLTFDRRIAGKPEGVEFPVYPQIHQAAIDLQSIYRDAPWESPYHFDCRPPNLPWSWWHGAGGHDFGEGGDNHPSALVAATVLPSAVDPAGLLVVRDSWISGTMDITDIESARRLMGQKYHITQSRWAYDPQQREAAKLAGGWAASAGSTQGASRWFRVSLINGRLNRDLLRFDFRNPAVVEMFIEMGMVQKLRRRVPGRGTMWIYNREKDDRTASLETLNELIFSVPADPPERMFQLPDLVMLPN